MLFPDVVFQLILQFVKLSLFVRCDFAAFPERARSLKIGRGARKAKKTCRASGTSWLLQPGCLKA